MKHAVPDHLSLFWREVCEQDYPCRIDLYTYQVIAVLVYRCVCYDYCSSTVRRCTCVMITVPWLYVGVHVLWLLFLDCMSVYIRYYYCSLTVCRCTCVMITVPWLYIGVHVFCFACIVQWSEVANSCPMCKTQFRSVIHNVRANDDYEKVIMACLVPSYLNWKYVIFFLLMV